MGFDQSERAQGPIYIIIMIHTNNIGTSTYPVQNNLNITTDYGSDNYLQQ